MTERKRFVLTAGGANVRYAEFNNTAIESRSFTVLRKGVELSWQAGHLMRPARSLQENILEGFTDTASDLLKLKEHRDYNDHAKERLGVEALGKFIESALPGIKQLANNMESLYQMAADGFSPVGPRCETDVVGFLQDQELRGLIRGLERDQKLDLMAAVRAGAHPEMANAILRAAPLLSGITDESYRNLSRYRLARDRADDLRSLKEMLSLYDSVMETASSAGVALCKMVRNSGGIQNRIEGWRGGCAGSESLREWLASFPASVVTRGQDEGSEGVA